ncbi:7532_t:CDS:2 [Funneliformis caledonium]|uniref:7532_t:CDS:1 n=1 Tax=Funneliformis caledonium TaxID=1117310 RepID=A0A9N8Z9K4_9GLOM|nr:7532_t:CDS:2 [Funneliformis caledonium]
MARRLHWSGILLLENHISLNKLNIIPPSDCVTMRCNRVHSEEDGQRSRTSLKCLVMGHNTLMTCNPSFGIKMLQWNELAVFFAKSIYRYYTRSFVFTSNNLDLSGTSNFTEV